MAWFRKRDTSTLVLQLYGDLAYRSNCNEARHSVTPFSAVRRSRWIFGGNVASIKGALVQRISPFRPGSFLPFTVFLLDSCLLDDASMVLKT